MNKDNSRCMGSYVFLWGQKQERTPTWYGLFTEDGKSSEVLDVMQFLWTGTWPENLAPHIYSLQVEGKTAVQSVHLNPGQPFQAMAKAMDPEGGTLTYHWEIRPEPKELSVGGDREEGAMPLQQTDEVGGEGKITLKSPNEVGAFRVFVYVYDDQNKVATANLPFFVEE